MKSSRRPAFGKPAPQRRSSGEEGGRSNPPQVAQLTLTRQEVAVQLPLIRTNGEDGRSRG